MSRKPIVAGNWKMNGTGQSAGELARGIQENAASCLDVELIVFPPFVYLDQVSNLLSAGTVACGGQDMSAHQSGAYTAEVSVEMLQDVGCQYVLLGHSERRQYHHETDERVAEKFCLARDKGLTPIVCVGETLAERENDDTFSVIERQVGAVLAACQSQTELAKLILAYEPVWAIGTGKASSPEQAQTVHQHIRAQVALRDETAAQALRILYGGSVKPSNAADLFAKPDIDGGLIGGAALQVDSFMAIATAAISTTDK